MHPILARREDPTLPPLWSFPFGKRLVVSSPGKRR
jgi:hypothetical protein